MTSTSTTKAIKRLWIDIETYSSVDLVKAGVYKYAQSQDFDVLLFAYAYDDDPVTVLDLTKQELPGEIILDLVDRSVIKKAHNAQFERICLSAYLRKWQKGNGVSIAIGSLEIGKTENFKDYIPPEGWYCTMVHSSMCGLPASLKQVGEALGLAEDEKKLAAGSKLIREFCMPCKPTKTNGGRTRNMPADDPEGWEEFIRYNRMDVVTERIIERKLSQIYTMPKEELYRYWIDQRINDTGIRVDMDLVKTVLDYGAIHSASVARQAEEISGVNIQSVKQLKEWLSSRMGEELGSLTKETVSELIQKAESLCLDDVVEALKLRQEACKLSIKKYEVFDRAVTTDNRIHGCFQFYGSRTGRFAGRLVQPQNLPRNSFENFHAARRMVKNKDWEVLDFCYDSLNDVFSTLIRTAFIPSDGFAYAVADYSAIEARVIAWLADETWRLQAFHEGKDIYCESASQMFHLPVEKHGINGHLRKQGKIAELALGYGGNVGALKAFGADKMGMTETEMADVVSKWRKASPRVCGLWKTMERMVKEAMSGLIAEGPKGMSARIRNGVLEVRLPSGRCLIYQHPRYEMEEKFKNRFCFDGLNQTTRKWEPVFTWGGKFTENVIQAIARDCLCTLIDRMQKYYPHIRIVMHIHDEVVVEVPRAKKEEWLQTILNTMAQPIDWAPGLELKGAGFTSDYYMKD